MLGTYHSWLHPEDAGSAIAVMKNAKENRSSMEIDPVAYQLATVAYFYNKELVDQCILNNDDLPTDELKQVEIILARANEPETPPPQPMPLPRRRYNYWQQNPVPL